jgi:hypothetical protein
MNTALKNKPNMETSPFSDPFRLARIATAVNLLYVYYIE